MVVAYILWHYARATVLENYSKEYRVLTEDTIFKYLPCHSQYCSFQGEIKLFKQHSLKKKIVLEIPVLSAF